MRDRGARTRECTDDVYRKRVDERLGRYVGNACAAAGDAGVIDEPGERSKRSCECEERGYVGLSSDVRGECHRSAARSFNFSDGARSAVHIAGVIDDDHGAGPRGA